MSLRTIVQALGGELYDRGRRANIPAPGHSAADRSVSLRLLRGEKSNAMPLAALLEKLKQEPVPA